MRYVTVNFTGSPAAYTYSFDPTFHDNPAIGDRVVVPTKMKGDGTVTLTIATVVSFSTDPLPGADKPVIAFLPANRIAEATAACAALEVKRVQTIS